MYVQFTPNRHSICVIVIILQLSVSFVNICDFMHCFGNIPIRFVKKLVQQLAFRGNLATQTSLPWMIILSLVILFQIPPTYFYSRCLAAFPFYPILPSPCSCSYFLLPCMSLNPLDCQLCLPVSGGMGPFMGWNLGGLNAPQVKENVHKQG